MSQVLVNCCGPYHLYGEPVVKACVKEGCHYLDVSGEPLFMERMQQKYHEWACDKGVYVISACGYDSVPADLGVLHLEKIFHGAVHSIECYMKSWVEGGGFEGALIHYGTYASAVHHFANYSALVELRKEMEAERPKPKMVPIQER